MAATAIDDLGRSYHELVSAPEVPGCQEYTNMPPVLRTALLHLLASSIVILHVLGYLAPELVIGSHFINVIAIPSLVTAGILLPKLVRIPGDAWKQDRFIKWGCSLFVVLALMEVLVYVALMLNVLA